VLAKLFVPTFTGNAHKWFKNLKPNSIDQFADLIVSVQVS
jgi:hypothetical protein